MSTKNPEKTAKGKKRRNDTRKSVQKIALEFVHSYKKSIFEKNFRKIGNTFRFQTVIISVRE